MKMFKFVFLFMLIIQGKRLNFDWFYKKKNIVLATDECFYCMEKCDDPLVIHKCKDSTNVGLKMKCYSTEIVLGIH